MRFIMHVASAIACLLVSATLVQAQQVVAPTNEPVGPSRGDDWQGFNVVNSFETGYRFHTVGGNSDTYRSTVNFGNGVRLLGNFLSVDSKNGRGKFFDKLVLSTQGLGGDPYQATTFRLQKNRLYNYDLLWRRNEYFNPGLVTGDGLGQHLLDTAYTLQDHNLTLFPQSPIRFSLGYSHDSQGGAGISTVQLFNSTGDIFPYFTNVKRLRNEYRIGNEIRWAGMTFIWTRGWENWKDDTNYSGANTAPLLDPGSPSILNLFSRSEPYHGTSPYWRAALFRDGSLLSINGRFTYTDGQRTFFLNENSLGLNRIGAAANQQILSFGNGRRPVATGNLTISLFPLPKLVVTNHTSFYNVRTEGDSTYLQFDNATQLANILYFQSLGIRTVATDTDFIYEANRWLNLHAGYEYSNRRITSVEQFAITANPDRTPFTQRNELNVGSFGVRIKPVKQIAISFDGEVGRSNLPFTPKSDGNYQALDGRIVYKRKSLQLSTWLRSNYNSTSVTLSSYSSHSRSYAFDASWSPLQWFSFDASYSKLHLDTLGGIAFFAAGQQFPNQQSYYISNIHSANLGVRLNLLKRTDLYLGYSVIQDTGDGRDAPAITQVGPGLVAFQTAQTFPLRFQSPLGRVSFRISERVRWNAGYQYYGYREDFSSTRNFLANTGYTSLSWSF
jgi:hypothetical protein